MRQQWTKDVWWHFGAGAWILAIMLSSFISSFHLFVKASHSSLREGYVVLTQFRHLVWRYALSLLLDRRHLRPSLLRSGTKSCQAFWRETSWPSSAASYSRLLPELPPSFSLGSGNASSGRQRHNPASGWSARPPWASAVCHGFERCNGLV